MDIEREPIICSCNGHRIKGPWSTLIGAALKKYQLFYFLLWQTESEEPVDVILDLAIGPVGAEVIIYEDLPAKVLYQQESCFCLPVAIPAGERVSIRFQADGVGLMDIYALHVSGDDGPMFQFGKDE